MSLAALIVDEDYDTVQVLSEVLEDNDIFVLANGYNGEQAFQLYLKHKPDVVLLALNPENDGFFGLEQIMNADKEAKIIVVASKTDSETNEKIFEMGASAIAHMPNDISKIPKTIRKVCKKHSFFQTLINFEKRFEPDL